MTAYHRPTTRLARSAIVACAAISSLFLAGCPGEGASSGPGGAGGAARPDASQREPVAVVLGPVQKLPTERFVQVVGTLQGDEDVTVAAKVAGRVSAIYKDLGDTAVPGELLLEIDQTDYELIVRQRELAVRESLARLGLTDYPPADFDPAKVPSVQRARLQAENAEAKFQRGRQLHEQMPPLISDQDFADLQTAAAVARSNYDVELLAARALLIDVNAKRADLDIARQSLADAVLHVPQPRSGGVKDAAASGANASGGNGGAAPASGPATLGTGDRFAVAERMVSVGEYVKDGAALFRLVDTDPIKLRATAPEKYVSQVKLGQKALVSVEAYPKPFEGRVSRLNPQIDPASRTFQVEILVSNPGQELKPGGFAEARITTQLDPNVLFVPTSAVFSFAGVSKVFTVRDGKAAEILIELGQRRENVVEVVRGLKGSEQIVTSGINRLATGVPVKLGDAPANADAGGEAATSPTTTPTRSASAIGG